MHSPLPVLGRGEPERYESPAQVASDLNVSLLGALARTDSEWTPPLVLSDLIDPEAPFDAVADRIELLAGQMPLKLLGCIGLGDDPLRYRLAANLAARLARTGAQVTLVEAELHAPLLQPDRMRREGLVDMLLYGCSYTAVARDSGIPGVRVVSAGSHLWSGEPIHGDEWERVLATLRGNSDFALITTTTGLPAPILGMLARRLDSIVIAYALNRASREAVRRSYLALWDMDAPILGLVTEGPHAAASPRHPAPDRASAAPVPPPAPPARKATEAGPPAIGAEWASRLLGEPLAGGMSPMTEEVEVVIRQTSEVDAAAAALWEKEVERLRSILTAPDGVQPFLDAEAEAEPSPAPLAESDLGGLVSPPSPAIAGEPEPSIPSTSDVNAGLGAHETPIEEAHAMNSLSDAPPEIPDEPPAGSGSSLDWGAAIGAEIASWGSAAPPAPPAGPEATAQDSAIRGLERITIVAEDTFFAGTPRTTPPAVPPAASAPPPVPGPAEDPEPVASEWDGEEPSTRWDETGSETDEQELGASSPPDLPLAPAVPEPGAFEPSPELSPRTRSAEAAEEAAHWFAQLGPVSPPASTPSTPEPKRILGPSEPQPVWEPDRVHELASEAEPILEPADLSDSEPAPLAIERSTVPSSPSTPPGALTPLEPAAAEATFPWNRAEAAAEEDDTAELWPAAEPVDEPVHPAPARGTAGSPLGRGAMSDRPLPAREGPPGGADLRIIEEIEEELVGTAAAHAPAAADDEPTPSRTPWRVLVIGGLVGLAAVGLWAYQSGMIRLEPPPPRNSAVVGETTPKTPRPADQAATEAPPAGQAPDGATPGAPAGDAPASASAGADVPSSVAEGSDARPASEAPPAAGAMGRAKSPQDRISTSDMGVGGSAPPVLEAKNGATKASKTQTAPAEPKPAPAKPAPAKPAPAKPAPATDTPPPVSRSTATPKPPSPESAPAADVGAVRMVGDAPVGFGVHVSSFRTDATAANDLARFRTLGYPGVVVTVEVSGRGMWRRVVLGPYATASEAEDIAAAVRASGLSDKAQTMRLKP